MSGNKGVTPNHEPPMLAGVKRHAPIIGSSPTVDSSERSNLPEIKTSDSASTTRARIDDCCKIVRIFAGFKKASLTNAPTTQSHCRPIGRQDSSLDAELKRVCGWLSVKLV